MPSGTPTPTPILADGWWTEGAAVDEALAMVVDEAEDLAAELVEDEDETVEDVETVDDVEAIEEWEVVEEVVVESTIDVAAEI